MTEQNQADQIKNIEAGCEEMVRLLDRVFAEGAFKTPPMSVPMAYAMVSVGIWKLDQMTTTIGRGEDFCRRADNFLAFIEKNLQDEFVIAALRQARMRHLPFDTSRMPALERLLNNFKTMLMFG